jgi:hypothetical protein
LPNDVMRSKTALRIVDAKPLFAWNTMPPHEEVPAAVVNTTCSGRQRELRSVPRRRRTTEKKKNGSDGREAEAKDRQTGRTTRQTGWEADPRTTRSPLMRSCMLESEQFTTTPAETVRVAPALTVSVPVIRKGLSTGSHVCDDAMVPPGMVMAVAAPMRQQATSTMERSIAGGAQSEKNDAIGSCASFT